MRAGQGREKRNGVRDDAWKPTRTRRTVARQKQAEGVRPRTKARKIMQSACAMQKKAKRQAERRHNNSKNGVDLFSVSFRPQKPSQKSGH